MNLKQLYTLCTPRERVDFIQAILMRMEHLRDLILQQRIQSLRQARGRTIHERRALLHWAHFIGMRPTMSRSVRRFYRALFIFILGTISTTVGLIAIVVPEITALFIIAGYNLVVLLLLLVKPYDQWRRMIRQI
jgi:hypothetical protein